MFRRRQSGKLRRALQRSQDPELADLYEQLSDRQERVAALELELFEARSELASFLHQVEVRIGPLQDRLRKLQDDLRSARRQAARRAQWGDQAETAFDSLEQFERTWRKRPAAATAEPKVEPPAESKAEIKQLYRALAKRFHPDLTTDPKEKSRRESIMAEVNEAYAAGDLERLRLLTERADEPETTPTLSREDEAARLRKEVERLDSVIHQLQRTLDELTRSHDVQIMLEATMARRQGRDYLGELAADLRRQIAQLELELADLS